MSELARILIYGDLHLSSKNYGAHFDYPKDSLNSLRIITDKAREFEATHIIGLGDLTYGRFGNLEYRSAVEKELETQYSMCNGNKYELKGNHDTAGYGMTEYEYYILKGLIKPAVNFDIGNVHFTMVNYGEHNRCQPNIVIADGHSNIILMHDYLKFKDTMLPNYGTAIELDNFEKWFGVDHIIGGHIHNSELFDGVIYKQTDNGTFGHRTTVDYIGSLSRPSYREGHTDKVGHIIELTIYDDNSFKYDRIDIELPPLSEVFNLAAKEKENLKKESKENRVDISDIVHQLDAHERNIGNPEDIIMALIDVPDKYKLKAIELLKYGNA